MIKTAITLLAFSLSVCLRAQDSIQTGLPLCPTTPEAPQPGNMVRPKYPKEALRQGIAGTVEVRAVIAPDGKITHLIPVQGDPEFSKSAQDAIRRWHFLPAIRQGHSVETTYKIHIRFSPLLREANSDVELESPQPERAPLASPSDVPIQSEGEQVHRSSEPGFVAPSVLYQPEPELSELSRKNAERGDVNIALVVGSNGLPRDLKVICSSIPASNLNAVDAVRQWRFKPATKEGKPIAAAIVVETSFKQ